MSSIPIDPTCPRRLQPQYACRNSTVVSAEFQSAMASSLNHLAHFRNKTYARFGGDVIDPPSDKIWRWAGAFGPLAKSMIVRIPCAPATGVTSTSNPRVQLALHDTSGNLLTSGFGYFGRAYGRTPIHAPNEWGMMTIGVDVSQWQGQRFRAQLIASQEARPISMCAYEMPVPADSESYARQQWSVGAPILDEDRRELQELAIALYERSCPTLFNYSSNADATVQSEDSAAYFNILGSALGGFGTEGDVPGLVVDLRYSCRRSKTTVPVLFECYAGMSAGTGGVRVADLAGNVYAEFSVTGSAAWQTAITANLPADRRTYVIEHKGDGTNAINTYAVGCFRYQS